MNLAYRKNLDVVISVAVGVFLASTVLFFSLANAAEEVQIQAAIKDLSSTTGQTITSEDQAKILCNQEQYLEVCADIGKKHGLYTSEEIKSVDDFFGEVKGKILDDIKSCNSEECLVRVAGELAVKIKTKNPTLATSLNLTTTIVAEKQAVVQAAKEVGVNFKDCESMNPDTASVDLLRKCARLAKDVRVQKYIPEEKRVLTDQFGDTTTIKLREALSAGKYQCGDNTLEGCGNYCLNPDSATRAVGIPAVCTQIAKEIFGQEGVKELESSYQRVGQVKDYYSKKFILTLPDGKELVGEGQIRNACDQAFSSRNFEVAKACGNFAVKNGFADQEEVDTGLKLMESFTQKGQNVDFEKCLNDPKSCRDLIPENVRGQFDAGNQIFEIMKTEIGFDPSQCERGAVDQTIGAKCFEGSKRALAKIEGLGLAAQSREAKLIIEEIRGHISEGENFNQRKDEFKQVFSQQGGPGGCKSEAECYNYCSNPTNGPECIAFGSQQNVSGFRGQEAVQKFQEYNQNVQKSSDVTSNEYKSYPSDGRYPQYPGQQGPYPGFQPPGQGGFPPPGQIPGFTQPGPSFSSPGPECFAAIQSGDFVRAKTACYVPPLPTEFPKPQICPASPYVECPAGQYRESFRNNDGCWVDGPCKSAPTYSSGPYPTYSPGPTFTPSGDPVVYCQKRGGIWDSNVNDCRFPDPTYSPYPTGSSGPYPTYLPPSGQKNQIWNANGLTSSIRSDADPVRIEKLKTACAKVSSGANIWMPGAGDYASNDFGMPNSDKCQKASSCTSGQYFDGTNCVSSGPYPTYSSGPYPTYSYSPYPTTTGGTGDMYSCFYPNATKNGTSPGYTVWCEKDYFNCHEGSRAGSSISLDGLALGVPSSCESGYYGKSCNKNNFCDSNETYTSCPSDCGGTTYSPYPSPGVGSCPSGYHSHGDSGGYCMNDQENYGGTCYNSAGTSKITCPIQPSYSPYPSSSPTSGGPCPSGAHTMYVNSGDYCMSDADLTKCGPLNSTSVSNFGSCSGYQTTATYSPSPTSSYTPPTTYTPYPTTESTPYPTVEYTPTPTYSSPAESYTPPPAYSESPPPTSSLYNNRHMIAHCQQLGRTWNGKICQANGLFAKFYEGSGMANMLKMFYIIP